MYMETGTIIKIELQIEQLFKHRKYKLIDHDKSSGGLEVIAVSLSFSLTFHGFMVLYN